VRLVLAMAAAGVVLGSVSIARRFNDDEWRVRLGWAGAGLLIAAAVVATTVIGVPKLLEFLREQQANRHGGRFLRADAAGASLNALLNLVGASTGALVVTGAWAMRLGRGGGAVGGTERWIIRKLKPLAQKLSMMGLNLAAMLTGPVFLVAIAVVCLDAGSQHPAFAATDLGGNSAELGWVGLSAILFLALYVFGDLVAWSLHPLYKRRLSGTFALRRRLPPDSNVPLAEPRPYKFKYRLSDSQPDQFPRVLISATLNVTDYGLTSTGSNAVGFVFSTDKVGCDLTDRVPTADYEAAFNSRLRDFTLPTAVSITGAAVSPAMGKMTRKPIRFLLALLNIRLGVWVPNPMRMTEGGTKRIYGSYGGPSLWLLVNELFGRYHLDAKFLYVSDGGHYENMGLVELLRRGCTTVWAVDASGDSISTFHTFSEAVALARAELGVEINLDPSAVMAPDPKTPSFVRSAHAVGDIRYQDGTTGHIVLIKAGVPADAPYDVRDFHASHPGFPCDPTINQLYTGERFEAYRSLGYFAGSRALAEAADADGDPLAPVTAEAG
jgi:hypothetical protein